MMHMFLYNLSESTSKTKQRFDPREQLADFQCVKWQDTQTQVLLGLFFSQ